MYRRKKRSIYKLLYFLKFLLRASKTLYSEKQNYI